MTKQQEEIYETGRRHHAEGYTLESCRFSLTNSARCWWVAGFIDADMEAKPKVAKQQWKEGVV